MSNTQNMGEKKGFLGDVDGKLAWHQIAESDEYQINEWVCI